MKEDNALTILKNAIPRSTAVRQNLRGMRALLRFNRQGRPKAAPPETPGAPGHWARP